MKLFAFPKPAPVASSTVAILTPCIGVCDLDPEGYCEGCQRTGDEIACWASLSDAQRQWYLDEVLPEREARRSA
jgi:hypothetical protein